MPIAAMTSRAWRMPTRRIVLGLVLWAALIAGASGPALAQTVFRDVSRVVVFGDLHGDSAKFEDMLRTAGLVDGSGNWAGGHTHLVQVGDVPDRGPNSRAILDHLMRLEPQARRAGGYVHVLIGNHEAMNMEGDLRYTSPGEFASYASPRAAALRDNYYERLVTYLRAHPPAGGSPAFDAAYRVRFDADHPLGWVEHQVAWAPDGVYGRWVAGHDAIIVINDMLFLHAGIGPTFPPASIDQINGAVRAALRGHPIAGFENILDDEQGPLWYRGLALDDETSEAANVEALLARYGVAHIIVGHTKRTPTIAPRFGGKVILTDVQPAPDGSDPHAYLEILDGHMFAIHRGQRIPLDGSTDAARCAYLNQVAAADGDHGAVAPLASHCERMSLGAAMRAEAVNQSGSGE